jgi:hypothetical protein
VIKALHDKEDDEPYLSYDEIVQTFEEQGV